VSVKGGSALPVEAAAAGGVAAGIEAAIGGDVEPAARHPREGVAAATPEREEAVDGAAVGGNVSRYIQLSTCFRCW
jgi:hypothetical protein